MNPYQSPEQQATGAPAQDHPASGSPEDHPLYDIIHRMVIWGEDSADIFRRMEVNGIPIVQAQAIYQHAWNDRISTIQSDQSRRFFIGLGLVAAAVSVFFVCGLTLGFIPKVLWGACLLSFGVGCWKAIDGAAGYLMAANKKGSLHED